MAENTREPGKTLKVWTWILIVLSLFTPIFGVASIPCAVFYRKHNQEKGAKLLYIAIIATVVSLVYVIMKNLMR